LSWLFAPSINRGPNRVIVALAIWAVSLDAHLPGEMGVGIEGLLIDAGNAIRNALQIELRGGNGREAES
jgi:hypothetical protein